MEKNTCHEKGQSITSAAPGKQHSFLHQLDDAVMLAYTYVTQLFSKKIWITLTCRCDLALLKSTGSRFDSFCIAVCGTGRLDSRVNGPACETAVDQPHRKKRRRLYFYENRQEDTCRGPRLQLPALTLEEKRLPPMAKPCKTVSTTVSTDASDRKSRKKENYKKSRYYICETHGNWNPEILILQTSKNPIMM